MIDWRRYPDFSEAEFHCKETGECDMQPEFLEKLQALRFLYGKPMVITSGYRSVLHSIEAAKTAPGYHSGGIACDVRVSPGEDVYELLRLAFLCGFTGIGVSMRGGVARYVHLDTAPRKAAWGY